MIMKKFREGNRSKGEDPLIGAGIHIPLLTKEGDRRRFSGKDAAAPVFTEQAR
jgi:hypothetical protein